MNSVVESIFNKNFTKKKVFGPVNNTRDLLIDALFSLWAQFLATIALGPTDWTPNTNIALKCCIQTLP